MSDQPELTRCDECGAVVTTTTVQCGRCNTRLLPRSAEGGVIVGGVRASFDYIGEGHSGDYNPDDPHDEALLRLDVNLKDGYYPTYGGEPADEGWVYPDQGSVCTQVRDDIPIEADRLLLTYAACFVDLECRRGSISVKRMMDVLSYLPDLRYIEERREAMRDGSAS